MGRFEGRRRSVQYSGYLIHHAMMAHAHVSTVGAAMRVHVCMAGDGLRCAVVHALHASRIHSHVVHARHVLHGPLHIHGEIRVLLPLCRGEHLLHAPSRCCYSALSFEQITVGSQDSP